MTTVTATSSISEQEQLQNGNIQHSSIKYTEDGDTLIDARAAKFADTKDVADADKYSLIDPDAIDDAHPIDIYSVILK